MIKESLFNIPYWKIQTINFEEKKKELTKLLESYPEEKRNGEQSFSSNRHTDRAGFAEPFSLIMNEELKAFAIEIETDFMIAEIWSANYGKGDYQHVHNHSSTGLSGILYLDLPKDSPVTFYLQPWNDIIDDTVLYLTVPVVEGDIVIIPSFVMHFSEPNKSNSKKRIMSWDMKIKKQITRN